ncbi:MAG: helix-turn-helix domain-containing protein [Pseudonocardiaceae bacterium]
MQVDGTRVFRVKAVAEMLDVSVSTVYRAIRAGELDAYKLGTGKGAVLRVPAHAIPVYLDSCGDAAHEAYVEGGTDPAAEGLSPAQADGLACVVCNADFLTVKVPHRPVGRSHTGSQVFACVEHRAVRHAVTGGYVDVRPGPTGREVAQRRAELAEVAR